MRWATRPSCGTSGGSRSLHLSGAPSAHILPQTHRHDLLGLRSIREAAGQSVKSSIFHTWVRDNRDAGVVSSRGALLRLRHEFAGVGGSVRFYKVEAEGQLCRRLFDGVVRNLFLASLLT
jgi:outer membrane protein assembly factor BamA